MRSSSPAAQVSSRARPSASERSYVLSGLGPMRRPFSPVPGVDLVDGADAGRFVSAVRARLESGEFEV